MGTKKNITTSKMKMKVKRYLWTMREDSANKNQSRYYIYN